MCLLTFLLKETGSLATQSSMWRTLAMLDRNSNALLSEYRHLLQWRQRISAVHKMIKGCGELPAIADGYRIITPVYTINAWIGKYMHHKANSSFDSNGDLIPQMKQHYHRRFQDYPDEVKQGAPSLTLSSMANCEHEECKPQLKALAPIIRYTSKKWEYTFVYI